MFDGDLSFVSFAFAMGFFFIYGSPLHIREFMNWPQINGSLRLSRPFLRIFCFWCDCRQNSASGTPLKSRCAGRTGNKSLHTLASIRRDHMFAPAQGHARLPRPSGPNKSTASLFFASRSANSLLDRARSWSAVQWLLLRSCAYRKSLLILR